MVPIIACYSFANFWLLWLITDDEPDMLRLVPAAVFGGWLGHAGACLAVTEVIVSCWHGLFRHQWWDAARHAAAGGAGLLMLLVAVLVTAGSASEYLREFARKDV